MLKTPNLFGTGKYTYPDMVKTVDYPNRFMHGKPVSANDIKACGDTYDSCIDFCKKVLGLPDNGKITIAADSGGFRLDSLAMTRERANG